MALSFLIKPLDRGLFPFSIWITMLWLIPSFLAICLVLRPSCCLVPPMSGVSVRHGLRKLWRKLFRAFTCVGCRCVDFSRYTLRLSYTAFNSSTVLREKAKVHRQHKHQVISRSAVFTSSPQIMQHLILTSLSVFHYCKTTLPPKIFFTSCIFLKPFGVVHLINKVASSHGR